VTVIEIVDERAGLTFRQRWSHYLAVAFAVVGLLIGINLRDSTINATSIYVNPQAGITGEYPLNWLLEEGSGEFIFRVRDISASGYSTTIQVSAQPVGPRTSARNMFDVISFSRGQTLAAYTEISREPFALPDETQTEAMTYVFAESQINPYLQNIPFVIRGLDILILARGQAIIITFLSESSAYEENFPILERFLESMEL
jgi:hypothetical protein